jgi:hypothetical protein
MKTKMTLEEYGNKLKSGEIETSSLDFPKASALRSINTLNALAMAGVKISGIISGEEVARLVYEIEKRGITVPNHKLAGVELRSLADDVRQLNLKVKSGSDIEVRKMANMSEHDRENWRSNQLYKNGFTLRNGRWVKMK